MSDCDHHSVHASSITSVRDPANAEISRSKIVSVKQSANCSIKEATRNDNDKAINSQHLERLKAADPQLKQVIHNKIDQHLQSSQLHASEGQYESAIKCLDKSILLRPDDASLYVQRAECFLRIADIQSAILNYKKACYLQPDCDDHIRRLAFLHCLQGQCLYDQRQYTQALDEFIRASELQSDVDCYYFRSIACLSALGRHSECLTMVNKRLDSGRQTADLYVLRSRLNKVFGNTQACYYDVTYALELDQTHGEAQTFKTTFETAACNLKDEAVRLTLLGRHQEAAQRLCLALEANPSVGELNVLRGAIYRRLGDFNAAIDDYLQALDKVRHDESTEVYRNARRQLLLTYNDFAIECFTKKFYGEAIVLLDKAIKEEKNEKGLYVNRGDCFYQNGDVEFALADYHQALELERGDEAVRGRIGAIYADHASDLFKQKQYLDSEKKLERALDYNPRLSECYAIRSSIRQLMANDSGARCDVLTCILLDPHNTDVISSIPRLFPGKSLNDVMAGPLAMEMKAKLNSLPQANQHSDAATEEEAVDNVVAKFPSHAKIRTIKPKRKLMYPTQSVQEEKVNFKMAIVKKQVNDSVKVALKNTNVRDKRVVKLLPMRSFDDRSMQPGAKSAGWRRKYNVSVN